MVTNEEPYSQYLMLKNNCDPDDPLLSETKLGQILDEISLDRICANDLRKFYLSLNSEQLLPTNDGLRRDYRGLGELLGFCEAELECRFKKSYNPTKSIIEAYISKNITSATKPTVKDLLKVLEKIERYDVIDDMLSLIINLVIDHESASKLVNGLAITEISRDHRKMSKHDSTIAPPYELIISDPRTNVGAVSSMSSMKNMLTIYDKPGQESTIFDAFLCYAPEDFDYAQNLLAFLDENGLCVTTSDDLLPGIFEHDSITQMIDSRCKKVIIILTPNFAKSKECEFQTKFASEINFKESGPKIIPIILEPYDDSELPSIIKHLSKLDLTNSKNRAWQMQRLLRSLQPEGINPHHRMIPKSTSNEITHSQLSTQSTTTTNANDQIRIRLTSVSSSMTTSQETMDTHEPIIEPMESRESLICRPSSSSSSSSNSGKTKSWLSKMWSSKRTSPSSSKMNLISNDF